MLKNKEEHLPDTQQQKEPPYYWKRWPGDETKDNVCHKGHMRSLLSGFRHFRQL